MYGEGQLIVEDPNLVEGVSIVIPARNEANYIRKTVEAIQKAIDELEIVAEIIVVNDDSTDQTADIAIEAGARVIDVQLRNIGAVRNAGAAEAIYPWLIFVDADTLVPAATIAATLHQLAGGDSGGGARVELPNPEKLFFVKRWMFYAVVLFWHVLGGWAAGCYMFCRKELFDSFGGFNEEYFAAEEYFFSKQLKALGEFRLVRPAVITSARKLENYSVLQLVKLVTMPLLNFGSLFQSRRGLDILYEDQR
ncbi:MAG: glycosyltransferase [Planctomycetota bacterium]